MGTLEADFHEAMIQIYTDAKNQLGYTATRFIQMVSERGGLETARHLLNVPGVSDGFTTLWEKGSLELSVEHRVLEPRFRPLFTEEELRVARDRLAEYGYEPRSLGGTG